MQPRAGWHAVSYDAVVPVETAHTLVDQQRLIELGKDHWELASYPLEGHGYVHPESWFDQYRRVLKLFERTLQP